LSHYSVPGDWSAIRKLAHAFRAADSSLVAYRLPINFPVASGRKSRAGVGFLSAIAEHNFFERRQLGHESLLAFRRRCALHGPVSTEFFFSRWIIETTRIIKIRVFATGKLIDTMNAN